MTGQGPVSEQFRGRSFFCVPSRLQGVLRGVFSIPEFSRGDWSNRLTAGLNGPFRPGIYEGLRALQVGYSVKAPRSWVAFGVPRSFLDAT